MDAGTSRRSTAGVRRLDPGSKHDLARAAVVQKLAILVAVALACHTAGVRSRGGVEIGDPWDITPVLRVGYLEGGGISYNVVADLENASA